MTKKNHSVSSDTADTTTLSHDTATLSHETAAQSSDTSCTDSPELNATSKTPGTVPLSINPKYSEISELIKKANVSRSTYYRRLRYLQITPWHEAGKAYLHQDQSAMVDLLSEHIDRVRSVEGFPIPEPSGPPTDSEEALLLEEDDDSESEPTPTPATATALATTEQKPGEQITQVNEGNEVVQASAEATTIPAPMTLAEVVAKRAQMNAVKLLATEELATEYLISNPDKLPPHLQNELNQVVTASRERQVQVLGKFSTKDLTNDVMSVLLGV